MKDLTDISDDELFIVARTWLSFWFKRHQYKESLLDCLLINRLIQETIRDAKEIEKIHHDDLFKKNSIPTIQGEVLLRFINQRYSVCIEKDFFADFWDEVWYLLQRYNEQEEML